MTCPYVISDDMTNYCSLNCDHGDDLAKLAVTTTQLAAVVAALEQYDADIKFEDRFEGELIKGRIAHDCVSAVAKAVGR